MYLCLYIADETGTDTEKKLSGYQAVKYSLQQQQELTSTWRSNNFPSTKYNNNDINENESNICFY